MVDTLLAEIRMAEGGGGAAQPLSKLGEIAVVEDKRDGVLRVARNHMKNSNGFVRKSATEAFCHWASKERRLGKTGTPGNSEESRNCEM